MSLAGIRLLTSVGPGPMGRPATSGQTARTKVRGAVSHREGTWRARPGQMLDRMPFSPCPWPQAPVLPDVRWLLAFARYVQIALFNLGGPGGHPRQVAGCVDVTARKDVGRS